jgi:hypothetical protein
MRPGRRVFFYSSDISMAMAPQNGLKLMVKAHAQGRIERTSRTTHHAIFAAHHLDTY